MRACPSEALPLLQQYYHLHGFGITSRNSTLRWGGSCGQRTEDGTGSSRLRFECRRE